MLNRLGCLALASLTLPLATACGSPTLAGYSPPAPPATATVTTSTVVDAAPPIACDADAGPPGASAPWPCASNFGSGVNVAWINFAHDVPGPNLPAFTALFQSVQQAGGRVARWWFHTNGAVTPGYDGDGFALPISCEDVTDVKHILDAAHAVGVSVNISLWSFDMLKKADPTLLADNVSLLSVDANRQKYIDNVLTPLVTALKGYPGLYSYEIFNEPEGMATGGRWQPFTGSGGTSVDISVIQKTINWFAAAIHAADPSARVTNGAWQFTALSPVAGLNYYSDAALIHAGGTNPSLDLTKGTLDYYEVHYYPSDGPQNSPFLFPASSWNLDKGIVVGEFHAVDQPSADGGLGVGVNDTYTNLHAGGYAGAWAWQYAQNDCQGTAPACPQTKWPAMQTAIANLYAAAPGDVDCH